MPAQPTRRPWWRYLRLSLRGLIIIVLVIGGSLGWVVHRARVQRQAVAAIEKAGGGVVYERGWGWLDSPTGAQASGIWAPGCLLKLVGMDYVDCVVLVDLPEDCAAALPHIRDLPQLRRLLLIVPSVTDAGLVNLEGLNRLEFLALNDSKVTDDGMKHLRGLSSLGELYLIRTQIGDAGLAELEPLSGLWRLSLADTHVSDAGLAHLKKLAGLRHLDLTGTRVTDAGVRDLLKARPSLEIIC